MVDGFITLGGKELPFRRTLGAMKLFDARYKGEISIMDMGVKTMSIEQLTALLFLFVQAGYASLNKPMDITEEWFDDNVTMSDLSGITTVLAPTNEADATKKNAPQYKAGTGQMKKVPLTR